MNTAYPKSRRTLPGSAFFIFTGQGNNGKTEQVQRLLTSRWPDGVLAIAPFLMITAEASTEGTAGATLADEATCLVWPVDSIEAATRVLATCFPDGKPPLMLAEARRAKWKDDCSAADLGKRTPPPAPKPTAADHLPLGGVGVDSASTLLSAQKTVVRETARDGKGRTSVSGKDLENDQKRVAAIATPPAQDFVDALSSVAQRNRGTIIAVAVHTRAQTQAMKFDDGVKDIVVGEAPDFGAPKSLHADRIAKPYSALWDALERRANFVWHMFGLAPDLCTPGATLADANVPGKDVTFGAVTMRGTYPKLGPVLWPKRQGGEGWLGWFDLVPRVWHPEVPWPMTEAIAVAYRTGSEGIDGHGAFDWNVSGSVDGVTALPASETRGYWRGPDAGLVFEQCLREVFEKTGGVS
jgi:hypothetical protein